MISEYASFTATVIPGAGRGKGLGTPTINLRLVDVPADIQEGVYAGIIDIPSLNLHAQAAAIHYGPRPVFGDDTAFEVHLLDLSPNTAPDTLIVHLQKRLRDVRNFESPEALKRQIAEDIRQTREIIASTH